MTSGEKGKSAVKSVAKSVGWEEREEIDAESAEYAEVAEKMEERARLGRRPLHRIGNLGGWR